MILEPIINMHKIKFTILEQMVKSGFINIPKSTKNLNIYINLDSIFNMFYREDLLEHIKTMNDDDRITLTSELINIAAHYRKFFWTRYHQRTTFYFYYMNKKPKYNISLYPDYCKDKIERKAKSNILFTPVNDLIRDNMKLMNIIIQAIPKVYLLLSNGLEPSLPPFYFINKSDPETDYNLVLTKDEYDYQMINDKTSILRLSYDKSQMINKDTLFKVLLKKNKYKPDNDISGYYYENILPLISCKSRNIKSYKGKGKVALLKSIDKNFNMLNDDLGFNIFIKLLKIDLTDELYDRYKVTNLKSQYKRLSKVDKMNIKEFIQDKYENRTIMNINSEHFPYNPIQLIELCYGINFYE